MTNTSPPRNGPLFFFSAGEPSGDIHASELISELRRRFPQAEFVGYGGHEMQRAGCRIDVMLTALAIMWFGRALWNWRTFLGYVRDAGTFFEKEKPDAVILVDFPGLNWLIAKKAKEAGIPVYYFMPPQLWAWGEWRIKKMKRLVAHVLCCLEFEEKWFRKQGCLAQRIGHPFLEEVRKRSYDEVFIQDMLANGLNEMTSEVPMRARRPRSQLANGLKEMTSEEFPASPILLILPGSRNQEVAANLTDMISAAEKVRAVIPSLYPVIAAFNESQAASIQKELETRGISTIPVFVGRTPELIKIATVALAVSGSVSMELLARAVPSVIYYRVGRIGHWVSRFFRRVKYITLTNLLAVDRLENESIFYDSQTRFIPARLSDHERSLALFPEYLVWKDESDSVADELIRLLKTPVLWQERQHQLRELLSQVDDQESPLTKAGEYIEQTLFFKG